jgi:hypothetical protein
MALIPCPECKKPISDKAKCCPHCGFPMPDPAKTREQADSKECATNEADERFPNRGSGMVGFGGKGYGNGTRGGFGG